jgi:SAM-dependent methyltransferase/uncharacterized protein YbaR (Trm112 family)
MKPEFVNFLSCPSCDSNLSSDVFDITADQHICDGVVWCTNCLAWYSIENELLDMLTGSMVYREERQRFWTNHRKHLESLGLVPDTASLSTAVNEELQLAQQAHFDWYAANDQQDYFTYEKQPFWLAADRLAFDIWRKEIQPGQWLLDVGCAEGRSTFKLMDLDINIAGFDVSRRLVRQAIDRYRKQHYQAQASFFCADATKIPLASGVMNYVLIYGVLHHVPSPFETCCQVVRILKPGGVYFGSENNTTIFRGIFDLIQRFNPIWHEEAGPEALISAAFFRKVFNDQPIHLDIRTSVYLPPHLINLMGEKKGYCILSATDKIAANLPYIKEQGGLIIVRAKKVSPDDH